MRRVGLLCPYSLSVPGGVQHQVLGLARSLRALGVEARVLGPCDGPPPDSGVIPLGNSIASSGNGSMAALAPDPAAALRTVAALRNEAFDVLHLHEPIVPGPNLVALMSTDIPMIGTFHRDGTGTWYRGVRWLHRWTTDRLALRFAVSEQAAATAQELLGHDYEVLWNGIDAPRYAEADPWPTEGRTVLFVGRHEPRKGLATLVEAFGLLPDDVRLWITGTGPETARLRQLTRHEPRIEWLGEVPGAEKLRRLRGAHAVAAPSVSGESFGIVLLEALAAGTPVVASDLQGYRNVVRDGREGILVAPGDAPGLARSLRRALDGGPAVEALVRAGRDRAESFGMDRLARRYLGAYGQVTRPDPDRRAVPRTGRTLGAVRARLARRPDLHR